MLSYILYSYIDILHAAMRMLGANELLYFSVCLKGLKAEGQLRDLPENCQKITQ
jgi:hypothetical protein